MTDSELLARLEKLERDNRRLKRLGVTALVLAGALGLIAAALPVPNVIRAHEFEVVDGQGNARIKLMVTGIGPNSYSRLNMVGTDGRVDAGLASNTNADELFFGQPSPNSSEIAPVSLGYAHGQAALEISSSDGEAARLEAFSAGPALSLKDDQGYSTEIGSTDLITSKTGETQHTSAASIVMFGNDKNHHVIWEAP